MHFHKFPKTHEPTVEEKDNVPVGPVLLSTVGENMEGFLENQVQCAKEAKKLHHEVGAPAHTNFRFSVKRNSIENCPVTLEDMDFMRKT